MVGFIVQNVLNGWIKLSIVISRLQSHIYQWYCCKSNIQNRYPELYNYLRSTQRKIQCRFRFKKNKSISLWDIDNGPCWPWWRTYTLYRITPTQPQEKNISDSKESASPPQMTRQKGLPDQENRINTFTYGRSISNLWLEF